MDLTSNNKKVSYYFDLPKLGMTARLEAYKSEDIKWNSQFMPHPNYIFGMEFEIENIRLSDVGSVEKSYWTTTGDGSLRIYGCEFISIPLQARQIPIALNQLKYILRKDDPTFSSRTSTHVHMNVRDLTLEQIQSLVLCYTVLEPLLFNWVGHNRDKNNFCVPLFNLSYTDKIAYLTLDPSQSVRSWEKYSALNLQPIQRQGTVEFRHMHGTVDEVKMLTWINMLCMLKNYAKTTKANTVQNKIYNLNTDSTYETFVFDILQEYAKELDLTKIQNVLEQRVRYCKAIVCSIMQLDMTPIRRTVIFQPAQVIVDEIEQIEQVTQRPVPEVREFDIPTPPRPLNVRRVAERTNLNAAELEQVQRAWQRINRDIFATATTANQVTTDGRGFNPF